MRSIRKGIGMVAMVFTIFISCSKDDLPLARFPNGNLQLKKLEQNRGYNFDYFYDANGKLIRVLGLNNGNSFETRFSYNADTLTSAEVWNDATSPFVKYTIISDNHQNIVRINTLAKDNLNNYNLVVYTVFTYNSADQLTKETVYSVNNSITKVVNYTYSIDGDIITIEDGNFSSKLYTYTQLLNKSDAAYKALALLDGNADRPFMPFPFINKTIFSRHLPESVTNITNMPGGITGKEFFKIDYKDFMEEMPVTINISKSQKMFDASNIEIFSIPLQDSLHQKLYYQ